MNFDEINKQNIYLGHAWHQFHITGSYSDGSNKSLEACEGKDAKGGYSWSIPKVVEPYIVARLTITSNALNGQI